MENLKRVDTNTVANEYLSDTDSNYVSAIIIEKIGGDT